MSCRIIWLVSLVFVAATAKAQPLFEGATLPGEDSIKGKPKSVRVERETLDKPGKRELVEEIFFRPDGKVDRHLSLPQGKPVEERLQYDDRGRRTHSTVYKADGSILNETKFRWLSEREEEESDASGKDLAGRIRRRYDEAGRVLEISDADRMGPGSKMSFDYDSEGRPSEARIELGDSNKAPGASHGGVQMRLQITYPSEGEAVLSVFGPDNHLEFQLETRSDNLGGMIAQPLFGQQPAQPAVTTSKVEASDTNGNWIRRAEFARDNRTQVDQLKSREYRTIEYY